MIKHEFICLAKFESVKLSKIEQFMIVWSNSLDEAKNIAINEISQLSKNLGLFYDISLFNIVETGNFYIDLTQ